MCKFSRLFWFSIFVLALGAGESRAQAPAPNAQTSADSAEISALKANIERMKASQADWPNLARYRAANEKIEPAAKNDQRAVFMGDSITDIWIQPEFGGFFPGKPYIDRGISGQTTPQMLIRFRPDVVAL